MDSDMLFSEILKQLLLMIFPNDFYIPLGNLSNNITQVQKRYNPS